MSCINMNAIECLPACSAVSHICTDPEILCSKCGAIFGIMDVHFCKPEGGKSKKQMQNNDLSEQQQQQLEQLDWDSSQS